MTTNSDYTDTSSTDSSDSSSATYKYAQIAVPDYGFDITSSGGSAPTFESDGSESGTRLLKGNSFLRLGSFPDLTATSPAGFATSVTLAKLVGDPDDLEDGSEDSGPDAAGDLKSNTYSRKENYLLGFIDDTRSRNPDEMTFIAGQSASNTLTARQTETKRLLSKGGWWDHSDGNRISTTVGDKVEVVQGNYKLIVLGRKDPSLGGEALSEECSLSDASGGKTIDHTGGTEAEVMSLEWVKDGDEWSCYQDNGKGNLVSTFHGRKFEYFTGTKIVDQRGKDPGDIDMSHIDKPYDEDDDPAIVEQTWARSLSEYKGSQGKPIPTITELTHAKTIQAATFSATHNETFTAAEITEVSTGVVTEVIVGMFTEICVGAKFELSVAKTEFIAFKNVFSEEENETAAFEIKLKGIENEICGVSNSIKAVRSEMGGKVTKLHGEVTTMNGQLMNVYSDHIELAGEVMRLGGSSDELFEEVFIA